MYAVHKLSSFFSDSIRFGGMRITKVWEPLVYHTMKKAFSIDKQTGRLQRCSCDVADDAGGGGDLKGLRLPDHRNRLPDRERSLVLRNPDDRSHAVRSEDGLQRFWILKSAGWINLKTKHWSTKVLNSKILIVLTMIGISNSNKTCYQNGCQSRTNACI